VEGVELGFAGNLTERLSGQVGASFMKSKVLKSLVDTRLGRAARWPTLRTPAWTRSCAINSQTGSRWAAR
jgi:outer membrane receptor for monomeric catechols